MPQRITVIPSARRLMQSLRDIGYELPAAVADLIDNSLDADATRVDVSVAFEGADSWLRIADNGTGITAARLNEAMRYGTERDYREAELGRFGLGLKTASLSQCRRLTVATRTNPLRREIEVRRWDIDHVAARDSWELVRLSPRECRPQLLTPIQHHTGTVVMWERLDRVLAYKLPEGLAAEHGFSSLAREIEQHLAMVFHRFLSSQAQRRPLRLAITINDNPIDAWDPFARAEPATRRLDRQTLTLRHEGRDHTVTVQPFILPNQMQFSTTRAWEATSGPRKWNRQQGFYIYREDRMIQSGGWNRLRTLDEHTKLARIAVDIPRAVDTAFEINVSKMRVIIPAELREPLRAIASSVASQAQATYRQRESRPRGGASSPAGSSTGQRDQGRTSPEPGASSSNGDKRRTGRPDVPWALLSRVLEEQLGHRPQLLRRLLNALTTALDRGVGSGTDHEGISRQ
jgi:hypothetical protein